MELEIHSLFKKIDSIGKWEWYYSKLNVFPYSESVIFRSKLGEQQKVKFAIKDSMFSIIRYEKPASYYSQIYHSSWKFGIKSKYNLDWLDKFERENFKLQDKVYGWDVYDGFSLFSNLDLY